MFYIGKIMMSGFYQFSLAVNRYRKTMEVFLFTVQLLVVFSSASSLLWANPPGEIAIQLPLMQTAEQKLEALIEIKKRVPKLFSDAAQYDIDLMAKLN